MIRRPPRSTLFPYHDALPILNFGTAVDGTGTAGPRPADDTLGFVISGGSRLINLPGTVYLFSLDADSDRKSTRLNSSHLVISYAVFCLKKKNMYIRRGTCVSY